MSSDKYCYKLTVNSALGEYYNENYKERTR